MKRIIIEDIDCLVSHQAEDGTELPCPGTMVVSGSYDPGGPTQPAEVQYWCCDYCGATASQDWNGSPILD